MARKKSKYIPKPAYNPLVQAKKYDELMERLETHRKDIQAISKSHDNHINHLGNFARHDIKNAILSMDSILSTNDLSEFDAGKIESLSTHLEVIRDTIENFAKLVPYSNTGKFTLDNLMIAVQLLARADMQKNEIEMNFEYNKDTKELIELPFQAILQMINNIIINAIKALENLKDKKIFLCAKIEEEVLKIEIKDNGVPLNDIELEKIFVYGYSTTGGSGIGLYHARYLCELYFEGKITVNLLCNEPFNKVFFITLPIN